jgi:two-component system C4-dicarboxylate transport sensor histidine kinase DctB
MSNPDRRQFAGLPPSSAGGLSQEHIDDLAYVNRMTTLGSVVATVVHDLNNVLQTISGSVELMQARGDLSAYANDKVARIASQASRAMAIVADLAAIARRNPSESPTTDLNAVLERALALRQRHLIGSKILVHVDAPTGQPAIVRATEQQVLQLVLNLLINAEQALKGHDNPRIDIRVVREMGCVRLAFGDNGSGIPDAWREWIFEPFATTRPAGKGAGLGLAVAAAVTAVSGGRLTVGRSELGGAEVTVELPET